MGILCGWLATPEQDAPALLKQMLQAAAGCTGRTHHLHAAGGALAGCQSDLFEKGGIQVALEGHPVWRERSLAEVARASGDAHALWRGFEQYGKGVLEHLAGDFALAILVPQRNYALLAIDRVGIRPLAYAQTNEGLVFGSQTFCLLAHPRVPAKVRLQGIFDYLYFHMVPSPETLFEGIEKLQPGELLEYEGGAVRRQAYWQLEFSEPKAPAEALHDELHQQLRKAIDRCRDLPEHTGAFLSGGLDSSTVVGVLQRLQDTPVDAFAIGFDAEGFDEMEYARATAEHFGAKLHEYYVTPQDVLDAIPLVTAAYDEPFGNASAIPAYFCAKAAREAGKRLLLAGDGGDEIFAGNARYAKQKIFDLYRHVPPLFKRLLIEPAANHLPGLGKLRSYIEQAKVPMPQRMETYNFLHRFALNEIFSAQFLEQVDSDAPLRALQSRYDRAGETSLVKKMLFLDHKFTLADNDLRKVNRTCELAGVDVRYPLLQDEMLTFSARIPSKLLLRRLQLRAFYRDAMKGFLAPKTLEKHKHGFGLPFGLWMNEYAPLKAFAHENLAAIRRRGILDDAFIAKIIEAQQTGHATYYGVFIWVLIMLEQWLETHKETAGLTL